ncbi:MAG: hypothetical protein WBD20_02065 [Pirellulaceae bacterium]
MPLLLFTALAFSIQMEADAADLNLPLSVNVKTVAEARVAAPTQPMMAPMQVATEVPPTLPEGRLPQYQMKYRQRDQLTDEQRKTGVLWLTVSGGSDPLVIRASIKVDDKPFASSRQERLKKLVKISKATPKEKEGDELSPTETQKTSTVTASGYNFPLSENDLISRYASATGNELTSDQTHWLINNWDAGPELLLLKDPFQWFRADKRPVFQIVDRDQSGVIDAKELENATEFLSQCDTNRDEIVDGVEIDAAVKHLASSEKPFVKRLRLLADHPDQADVSIDINYRSDAPDQSKVTITEIGKRLTGRIHGLRAAGDAVAFRVGTDLYELSAIQDGTSDQIALGAVVEGYPLLLAADPNSDGRVTIRERRGFADRLKEHDRDKNGELTLSETPPTIRVCFARGPVVHNELVQLRSVPQETAAEPVTAPQWFTRMDRNADGDLSRSEFPGTDEQFAKLDSDQDGLIDASESLK